MLLSKFLWKHAAISSRKSNKFEKIPHFEFARILQSEPALFGYFLLLFFP